MIAGGLSRLAQDTIAFTDWQNPYLTVHASPNSQFYLCIQVNGIDGASARAIKLAVEPRFKLCFGDSCPMRGFILRNLNFETGKAVLTGSNPQLNELAIMLKANASWSVSLIGHTDNSGIEEDNQKLSEARAEAVKRYLLRRGVKTSQITSSGEGSSKPLVPNTSEFNKSINRRVELRFVTH